MSEELLRALMQLFALASDVDDITQQSRIIVKEYLAQELNQELVEGYIQLYDDFIEEYHQLSKVLSGEVEKADALDPKKIAYICGQINKDLQQKQKIIILLRILEYIYADGNISEHEFAFLEQVYTIFNVAKNEFEDAIKFIDCDLNSIPDSESLLIVDSNDFLSDIDGKKREKNRHIQESTLENTLLILRIESVDIYAVRLFGTAELYLNGQILNHNRSYILRPGSSIRSSKVKPIYLSKVISTFLSDNVDEKIIFKAKDIEYRFANGNIGLQKMSLYHESGELIGIMGGSGAGKSTLLMTLNGNYKPTSGAVTINGRSISDRDIQGLVGYIPQDDLLIEELTVFQNLYYNTKLCFADYSSKEIEEMVDKLLKTLGLFQTRDLKVGTPLEKTISGGQRKRLNIALELIREPSVLFVDEPTSGLSSRDSQNIMDLLKELALKGKVIFVVIHQPSSDIFKMFDKLLILDVGGYLVYNGDPVEAISYFKKLANFASVEEDTSGNVNPEIIFNIIDAKVVDEYGNLTHNRKVSPQEFHNNFQELLGDKVIELKDPESPPKIDFKIPNVIKQFRVFFVRDVLSKLTNKQYVFINFLEAPVLGLVLAYFVKFYNEDVNNTLGYNLFDNENVPAYMFMSVIVALFIGLTVSAEEIIRDQKIRKRESFLNLSNGSYLSAKILIMFILSAIQTASFILVGNTILEIEGLNLYYWVILFSISCFANLLGLNISSAFNSAVTIYILIPFLIIPQLIFSGVIVPFEKLNPAVTNPTHVPLIGDVMASRWAFEALSVTQFIENKYEKHFYPLDKDLSIANYRKVYWIPALKGKIGFIKNNLGNKAHDKQIRSELKLIRNEIRKELVHTGHLFKFEKLNRLALEHLDISLLNEVESYLNDLKSYYNKMYNATSDIKDAKVSELTKSLGSVTALNDMMYNHRNQSLADAVMDKKELTKIIEVDGELIQQQDPIYMDAAGFRAHFYAPRKVLFGKYYDTFIVNVLVLWLMTVFLAITLYFDVFRGVMNFFGKFSLGKKR